jgi:type IV pilus assembly protein PilV
MTLHKHVAGFTLIEALVALIVLSVGLLGLAAMQFGGLRFNTDSYHRSQATLLAYDMADRMRANRDGVENGDYNAITTTQPADPNCITVGCDAAEMAQYDAFSWLTRLADALPSGRGTVNDSEGDGVFTITVMWDEARTGATGESCSGDPDDDLQCLNVSFQP